MAQSHPTQAAEPILRMEGIQKSFGGVHALRGVDLELHPGEVLALVGENGAGKSTLVEVLCGNVRHDHGHILYGGRPVAFAGAMQAAFAGISIVHQELSMVPELTVAENIFCAREPVFPIIGFVDRRRLFREAAEILKRFDLDVDPRAPVGRLSVAVQQMIEIAKALSLDCKVLVLDEPTSALTETEAEYLFGIIGRLRERGVAIIYISHKLPEVFRLADRVMVLRDGQLVGTRAIGEVTPDDLVRMMVGRALGTGYPERVKEAGEVVLRVEGLTRRPRFRDVSFELRAGEILGVSGLVGAGRTEVARAIFGIDRPDSGTVHLDGQLLRLADPGAAIARGIGYVPEDRKELGLFLGLSIKTNIGAASLTTNSVAGLMSPARERAMAQEYLDRLRIRAPGVETITSNLSGGNQQKVLLAKWLAIRPRILMVDEPTRGVDVGAREEMSMIISRLVEQGTSVLLISSDLSEVLNMSHRVALYRDDRILQVVPAEGTTPEQVMAVLTGART